MTNESTVTAETMTPYAVSKLNYEEIPQLSDCLLYTSPSPRDATLSRMPSSA